MEALLLFCKLILRFSSWSCCTGPRDTFWKDLLLFCWLLLTKCSLWSCAQHNWARSLKTFLSSAGCSGTAHRHGVQKQMTYSRKPCFSSAGCCLRNTHSHAAQDHRTHSWKPHFSSATSSWLDCTESEDMLLESTFLSASCYCGSAHHGHCAQDHRTHSGKPCLTFAGC